MCSSYAVLSRRRLSTHASASVNGFWQCSQSNRRPGKWTYVAFPQISRCRIQRSFSSCTVSLMCPQWGHTATSCSCLQNICSTSRSPCSSSAYSVTTIPGSPSKMLKVLALTCCIINTVVRFTARAASRMILTGPLGSRGVSISGPLFTPSLPYSIPLFPTILRRTMILWPVVWVQHQGLHQGETRMQKCTPQILQAIHNEVAGHFGRAQVQKQVSQLG